jgi:toxin YoeB
MRLEFDPNAWEDVLFWKKTNRKKLAKIFELLSAIGINPLSGIGKPEQLKYGLSGCWSRRIDKRHRIVYKLSNEAVIILSCRYHY